jgi:DNA-binding HxlR family transcriptional regulator
MLESIADAMQAKALSSIAGGAAFLSQIQEASGQVRDLEPLQGALRNLREYGAIERTVHAGPPFRVSYELTDRGRELHHIIEAMKVYSATHLAA